MKGKTFSIIFLIVLVFILILVASLGLAGLGYYRAKETCERYSDYGYVTDLYGNFYAIEGYGCNIIMEDGTKVAIYDFNIADYKKPALK